MALPVSTLPTSEVTVLGQKVTFRSLSRNEAIELGKRIRNREDTDAWVLAKAMDQTEAEAAAWLDTVQPLVAWELLHAILVFSGVDTPETVKLDEEEEAAGAPKG